MPTFMKLVLPIAQRISFIRRSAFKSISEIGLHYRYSKLSIDNNKSSFPNKAPRPGDRVLYLPEVQTMLSDAKFHLLIFMGEQKDQQTNQAIQMFIEKYNELISVHEIKLTEATKTMYKKFGITKQGCYFIRPDNYIAYRSNSLQLQQLTDYIEGNILTKK